MGQMEKPIIPKPAEPKMPGKKMNVWMIVSIILLIILIGIVAAALPKFINKNVVSPKVATDAVISFVNEIYGAQLGNITAKNEATEEIIGLYKLYKVTLVLIKDGAPVEEAIYVTKDGKTFIPAGALIDMAKMKEQFQTMQAQPPPAANVNANINTNTNQPPATGAAE